MNVEKILKQDRRALARAITLVESQNPEHYPQAFALLDALLPHAKRAVRIGISGAPGVGKSTFIEVFGLWLIAQNKSLAVLTVDPSSTQSQGSVLGDKTRMQNLSADKRAFIRPSPSSGKLGGVTFATREALLVCEAAGFDVVIIETVGVGQSEITVASMVDTFVLLVQPGGGDELQGAKKGILELVDIIVVNKADGDLKKLANQSASQYLRSVKVPILKASALHNQGIQEVWQAIEKHRDNLKQTGAFPEKIKQQNKQWFLEALTENFLKKLKADLKNNAEVDNYLSAIDSCEISVAHAAFLACNRLGKIFLSRGRERLN